MKKYKNLIKYSKTYFEIYAKKTLEYCYDERWINKFESKREKPDLQSEELDIGIEVTRTLQTREGKMNHIFNEFINKRKEYNIMKYEIESLGGEISKIGNSTVMSPTKGLCDFKNNIDDLVDSIKVKTIEKLPNYKKFSKNMLYIFTHTAPFTKSDIVETFNILNQELPKDNPKFDLYFINCIDEMFVVDVNGNILNEITISGDYLERIKKEALDESKE